MPQAAVTHEIGHLLGLSHPDEVPSTATGRPGAPGGVNVQLAHNLSSGLFDCLDPWASVAPRDGLVPPANGADTTRESVMRTLTQFNPNVCLFADDLEALSVLYPDCSDAALTTPVCFPTSKYIGIARFFGVTFVPIFVACVCVVLLNYAVQVQQHRKVAKVNAKAYEMELARDDEISTMVTYIVKQREKELRKKYKLVPHRHGGSVAPDDGVGDDHADHLAHKEGRRALRTRDIRRDIEVLKRSQAHRRMSVSSDELTGHAHGHDEGPESMVYAQPPPQQQLNHRLPPPQQWLPRNGPLSLNGAPPPSADGSVNSYGARPPHYGAQFGGAPPPSPYATQPCMPNELAVLPPADNAYPPVPANGYGAPPPPAYTTQPTGGPLHGYATQPGIPNGRQMLPPIGSHKHTGL